MGRGSESVVTEREEGVGKATERRMGLLYRTAVALPVLD